MLGVHILYFFNFAKAGKVTVYIKTVIFKFFFPFDSHIIFRVVTAYKHKRK